MRLLGHIHKKRGLRRGRHRSCRAKAAANQHGELGHPRAGHGGDQLSAVAGNAAVFVFLPTIKPVMFCKNTSGILRWQQLDKVRALERRLGKQDAIIGDPPTGQPSRWAKPHTRVVP